MGIKLIKKNESTTRKAKVADMDCGTVFIDEDGDYCLVTEFGACVIGSAYNVDEIGSLVEVDYHKEYQIVE
jgi:hypothetical protein